MRSAVTISLVTEATGGPFVYWHDLEHAFADAAKLGFDGIEIFAPSPEALRDPRIRELSKQHNLAIAAVGTGAGWVKHKLALTSADAGERARAVEFIASMIDAGAELRAPAIIGSMQGRWSDVVSRPQAEEYLAEALRTLSYRAGAHGVSLFYEPLNRYETNLFTTLTTTLDFLNRHDVVGVEILADLFHMNIEEANLAEAIRGVAGRLGHVHFADSNRQAMGLGHTDFAPIHAALKEIGYTGWLSAEVFAKPDSHTAAMQTITSFRSFH
ncbi:MAG: TIM barrel protein [Fimbriiglobus sp.]